jgi:hypothetical protein
MKMKDTKTGQLVALVFATVFTGFMIYFIKDPGSASAIAVMFTAIVGTFIGLDIALMIKKTASMPEGYKRINAHRYIAGGIIFAALLVETFVISGTRQRNCDSLYTSFGMGFLAIISGFIVGVEGNKIATKGQEPQEGQCAEN